MATLEFDRDKHIYTVDGVVVPSVTDICAIYGDEFDESMEDVLDRAADRGVTLHKVIELMVRGEDYDGEYPSMYAGYVEQIEAFFSSHVIVPIAIEEPIYSERLGVAGTPDMPCFMDDVLTIPDWKFVCAINKPKVRAQLTGYAEIYKELGVFPERLMAVQFLPDRYREYPVAFGGDEWEVAVKAWEIKHRKYKRGMIG